MFKHGQLSYFSFPTPTTFGVGSLETLPAKLGELGVNRALIITDRFLATSEIIEQSKKLTKKTAVGVFSDFSGNPLLSHVEKGTFAFKSLGADGIIAIGGGAALDVAKAIALVASNPGNLFDYSSGVRIPTKNLPPVIAIPTTAGTGSEVGRSTVISEDESKKKHVIFHPWLLPKAVILDANLTADLPAPIVAATGMDALSHLLESFVAPDFHPICDGIALEGLRLLAINLPKAYENAQTGIKITPEAISARALMLLSASMGAMAFQKGLGATHSCAHALSTVCDLHHGLANGVMIPYVMKFNEDACHARFERVTQALGLKQGVTRWLCDLQNQLEIPAKLSALNVKKEHVDRLVAFAVADGCHQTNPKAVGETDFRNLFHLAL